MVKVPDCIVSRDSKRVPTVPPRPIALSGAGLPADKHRGYGTGLDGGQRNRQFAQDKARWVAALLE